MPINLFEQYADYAAIPIIAKAYNLWIIAIEQKVFTFLIKTIRFLEVVNMSNEVRKDVGKRSKNRLRNYALKHFSVQSTFRQRVEIYHSILEKS